MEFVPRARPVCRFSETQPSRPCPVKKLAAKLRFFDEFKVHFTGDLSDKGEIINKYMAPGREADRIAERG